MNNGYSLAAAAAEQAMYYDQAVERLNRFSRHYRAGADLRQHGYQRIAESSIESYTNPNDPAMCSYLIRAEADHQVIVVVLALDNRIVQVEEPCYDDSRPTALRFSITVALQEG